MLVRVRQRCELDCDEAMEGFGEVWYCPDAIANILSLALVAKKYPVSYDSRDGNMFVVHKPGKEILFKQSGNGLFYHDFADRAVVLVNMVTENREGFTDREYQRTQAARRALAMVGYPSPRDFEKLEKQPDASPFP